MTEIENYSRLRNERFMTLPCVIHGNGPSKVRSISIFPVSPSTYHCVQVVLNRIGNYVPRGWHSDYGCRHCDKNLLHLTLDKVSDVDIKIILRSEVNYRCHFYKLPYLSRLLLPSSKSSLTGSLLLAILNLKSTSSSIIK